MLALDRFNLIPRSESRLGVVGRVLPWALGAMILLALPPVAEAGLRGTLLDLVQTAAQKERRHKQKRVRALYSELIQAIQRSNEDGVTRILANPDLNIINLGQRVDSTPEADPLFLLAVKRGNSTIVRALLDKKPPGETTDEYTSRDLSETPLYFATFMNYKEIVPLLLAAGANPNLPRATNAFIVSPLTIAAAGGHEEIVTELLNPALLERRANPNHSELSIGTTALEAAVQNNHIRIVKILLDAGAQVDALGTNGLTPLALAAKEGHKELVQLFLERGANPRRITPTQGLAPEFIRDVINPAKSAHIKTLIQKGRQKLQLASETQTLSRETCDVCYQPLFSGETALGAANYAVCEAIHIICPQCIKTRQHISAPHCMECRHPLFNVPLRLKTVPNTPSLSSEVAQ